MKPSALLLCALCVFAYASKLQATNPVQIENAKAGTDDWLLFSEATQGEIEGYASATSVNQGESIRFYVNTTAPSYDLDIFRVGWYGGLGARRMAPTVNRPGIHQPIPTPDAATGLIECNWTDPYTITIPNDWVSGAYLAKLTTVGAARKNRYILFVVRQDARHANHNFQLTVTTGQAYNNWGGKSLYSNNSTGGAARKVSFNRPYEDGSGTGVFLWRWEYAAVRFLEREGYDVTYTTNIDTHRRGSLLLNAKSFLSIGHDEYWSWEMRANVESALANGVNLGFLSANTCYWQVRFEPSAIDGAPDRTMVGYKEAALSSDPYAKDDDPSNDNRITTQWRLAPVNRPEAALLGVQYIYFPVDAPIVIDDVTSAPWVFAETGLAKGSSLPGLLGYEVDAMHASTPAGTMRLGHSPFTDTSDNTTRYSDMTLYSTGNAWVFATGSMQWAWGLDNWNSDAHGGARVHAGAQQLTRNILRQFAGSTAGADCQIRIDPAALSVSDDDGSGSIAVTTASNCTWAVASSVPWITVTSIPSSAGNGTVTYQYASNTGNPARTGTIGIGEATFTLHQASGCEYSVSPESPSVAAAGGTIAFTITTNATCGWNAVTDADWLTFSSPASGTGSGTVNVTAAANSGPSRDGGVYINGTYYNVHQSSGCSYFVQPTSLSFPASGGSGEIAITTGSDCSWISSSNAPWIILTDGTSGRGDGTTSYLVSENTTGAARTATIGVAGTSVTVRQSADDCLYELSPLWASYTASSATGTIKVTSDCAWTAVVESGSSFIAITSTSTTAVNYSVAQNTSGLARSGTIRIAGRAINITQNAAGAAIFSLNATATSTSAAALAWPAVAGASNYEVYRSSSGGSFGLVTTTSATTFIDGGLSANRTYLYRIRALGSSGPIAFSVIDPATTVMFTDPTIVPGSTKAKAAHVLELRIAVNAMRAAAFLPSQIFADPSVTGLRIKAVHIAQLRSALADARAAIGLPPVSYSAPSLTTIRASHVTELRAGVQ